MIGFWIAVMQFVIGLLMASVGAWRTDVYDDRMGIRPGGYGSNISYIWPWGLLCQLGFVMALTSPFTLIFSQ